MLYLSRHTRLQMDPIRVIKFIKPEFCKDERIVKRLAREVEVTASLSQHNEHVVRVYDDFGEFPDLGHYFVMEYLQGKDLYALLQRNPLLPFDQVFHIFRQICRAIHDAHQAQIVHRDLKPQNVFLITRRNDPLFVKVIDFGIAKTLANENSTALTQGIIGTPEYMAPEQCSGRPVDHRTDIYALGTILYAMLVGYTPYLPPERRALLSFVEMAVCQMMEEPVPPSRRREELQASPSLDAWISTALAKKPDARFSSVAEMLEALTAIEVELLGYPLVASQSGGSLTQPLVISVETDHALAAVQHTDGSAYPPMASLFAGSPGSSPLLATGIPLGEETPHLSTFTPNPAATPRNPADHRPWLSQLGISEPSASPESSASAVAPNHAPTILPVTIPVVPSLRVQPSHAHEMGIAQGSSHGGRRESIQHTTEIPISGYRRLWLWGIVGVLLVGGSFGVALLFDSLFGSRRLPSLPQEPKKATARLSTHTQTPAPVRSTTTPPRQPAQITPPSPPTPRIPERFESSLKTRTPDPAENEDNPSPRVVIRRVPKQKSSPRIIKPSVVLETSLSPTPPQPRPRASQDVPGCPAGDTAWIRIDLQPAQARVITSHRKIERYSSWICVQRPAGNIRPRFRMSLPGYYHCFFLLPATGRRFRVKLQISQGMNDLEPDPQYCLQ